jgi:hypothetical protein
MKQKREGASRGSLISRYTPLSLVMELVLKQVTIGVEVWGCRNVGTKKVGEKEKERKDRIGA